MCDCMPRHGISHWPWLWVCVQTHPSISISHREHDSGVYVHVWAGLLGVFIGAQWATRECYHSGSCPVNEFGWLWITCRVWTYCKHKKALAPPPSCLLLTSVTLDPKWVSYSITEVLLVHRLNFSLFVMAGTVMGTAWKQSNLHSKTALRI